MRLRLLQSIDSISWLVSSLLGLAFVRRCLRRLSRATCHVSYFDQSFLLVE
jgi:hypothetical protein